MRKSALGGFVGAILFGIAGTANAVVMSGDEPVIDDFSSMAFIMPPSGGGVASDTQVAPAGAIGDRRISIESASGFGNSLVIFNGMAIFSGFSGDTVYTIEYGVNAPLNLTLPGLSFKFEVLASDLDDRSTPEFADFTTTLTSGAGVVESATIQLSGEGEYKVPFSLFSLTDFSDVDHIAFSLDTSGIFGPDIAIGPIVDPIPEPATATLFGLGLLGLLRAQSRRRR